MTRAKIATAVAAAFSGMFLSAQAGGIVYPVELTNGWFAVDVSGMSNPGGPAVPITTGANWTAPAGGEAYATNRLVKFDAETTSPLVYTPGSTSGEIALVNVRLLVEPNVSVPSTEGLDAAQAALTVVTNTSSGLLDWNGLVRDGATNAWVALTGENPAANSEYDVQIAIDNRTSKKIRYAVRKQGETDFTVLESAGEAWLENPLTTKSSVSAVAFAGTGTIGDFSGGSIVNDGAGISSIVDGVGYDFTNGTVTAVVTIPGDNAGSNARTALFIVTDFATGAVTTNTTALSAASTTIPLPLTGLTPGMTYAYTLIVKSGDTVRAEKSGTFAAANWSESNWFSAAVVNGEAAVVNGEWTDATLNSGENRWDVSSDAVFTVTDVAAGSNVVARVDTKYAFSTFTDVESLESLDNAIGGIVAVLDNGGSWCAYTGAGETGWQQLSGGVVPNTNVEYVVRAEFDFLSNSKRVRYLVSSDAGTNFVALSLAGVEWLPLADSKGTLSSVGMSGSGYVKSIFADVADEAVAKDSHDKRFKTLWEAARDGEGAITLLTNATFKPEGLRKSQTFTISKGAFDFLFDRSALSGAWSWSYDDETGVFYLVKPGATYIFF